MEILSTRILLRPTDYALSLRFYAEQLKLPVAREYPGGTVFFAGGSLIELAGHGDPVQRPVGTVLWLQVRDIAAAAEQLRDARVPITREAQTEPWGLIELHAVDPDGMELIFVEVPATHPLRGGSARPEEEAELAEPAEPALAGSDHWVGGGGASAASAGGAEGKLGPPQ
ncbi:MAG: VOC family protein [Mycolicibacterium sp.]|nr:VOC family protein [Mycolicibacterium sp.]